MGEESGLHEKCRISFNLNEKEYKDFLRWYNKEFLKEKDQGRVGPDFSNLKEETLIYIEKGGSGEAPFSWQEETVHIKAGSTDLRLLYSALTEVHRKNGLILFFAQKEFWVIPERVLGGEEKAEAWFEGLVSKCRSDKDARVPLEKVLEDCGKRGVPCVSYTRSVDQVAEAGQALKQSPGKMQKLRRVALFAYRYVGAQLLALEQDGIYEYGERSCVRHDYGDLSGVLYTEDYLYLVKGCRGEVVLPVKYLDQAGGMDRIVELCNHRRPRGLALLCPEKTAVLKLRRPLRAVICSSVLLVCILWGVNRHSASGPALKMLNETAAVSGEDTGHSPGKKDGVGRRQGLMVSIPDDTVFDEVGPDGTFVSSNLFYKITLPQEEWEQKGNESFGDILESSWGCISVRGGRSDLNPVIMNMIDIPRTKGDYIRSMPVGGSMGDAGLPEVIDYTYRKDGTDQIVTKELRYRADRNPGQYYGGEAYGEGAYRYSVDLNVTGLMYNYFVTIRLREENTRSIEQAHQILDTFRVLDTSSGICKEIEDNTFYGYYGKNYVMTSCLVLLEEDMSTDEIGNCLETLKKVQKGFAGTQKGDILALRTKDSRWLGIDSYALQGNCTKENARMVSGIFKSDVILYDEFDGDLLMVAYSDKEQKHVYQRATSFNKEVLESDFQCYGKEQEFPEDLLKYTDLSREEADVIWKDEEAVFQMDKWYEIAGHMTKMPVPREFIGITDYKAFDGSFEIIRR